MLPSSIQKTLLSKKYLIFTLLTALLIFCIGLYGISLATRKVENFSMFGTCGEGSSSTVCSGETPFCKITEKALPTDTLDQVLTFNTEGRYVEIVPNSTGSVELSQVAVYDSNGVNLALGKPVTASCVPPTIMIGAPSADDDQVVVMPRVFARYVRVRPGLQSDGYVNLTQVMVMNASMTNLASGKPVYATSSYPGHAAASVVTDNKTLTPQSGTKTFATNGDGTPGKMSEYLEIDLGEPRPIHSIRYIGRLKADYSASGNDVLERNRPRFELSSYSARSSPPTVDKSLTVNGTLTASVDLSKVCLMTGPSPIWSVDLGQSYKIAKIRYIGYNSGTGFYDASKNSITPTDRNTGIRFLIKNSPTDTTTTGTCIATPSYLEASYPPDATADEKKILKPYATSGIDLTKVLCIYRTIKNNSDSNELHTKLMICGLTDGEVAKSYAKMKFNNMSLKHNGWTITGSWSSPGNTITVTSGLKPVIGMKIGKVTTSNPDVSWSMSNSDIIGVDSAQDGKNFTISKTMTESSGKDVKIKLMGLDRVDYNGTPLLYADAISRVKKISKMSDIDFDKETCVRDYIKNSTMKKNILNVVDPTDGKGGPIDPAKAASNQAIVTGGTMATQASDPIEAVTDIFMRVLLPSGSDPNSGYTGVNDTNAAGNAWSTDVVGMIDGTPPVPVPVSKTLVAKNVTDTQVAAAPRTFNLNRTTVSRDDMDAAATATTINYNPASGDGTNEQQKEVYFVGGQFSSKEEAEQICSKAKATLANPIQLLNAWRRGAQWCEPGWVSMSFEEANSEKTRIQALIDLWDTTGGYGAQLTEYNNKYNAEKSRCDAIVSSTGYPDHSFESKIFYDASGAGYWLKVAGDGETYNPIPQQQLIAPWMGNTAIVRYGSYFAWVEMKVTGSLTVNNSTFGGATAQAAQTLITNIQNQINGIGPPSFQNMASRAELQAQLDQARAQLAATNVDPRPGATKELQLKIKSPPIPPAIRNANYTRREEMADDMNKIGDILAGLSANQFKAYKQFPAQPTETVSKSMMNKDVVKMMCMKQYTCPTVNGISDYVLENTSWGLPPKCLRPCSIQVARRIPLGMFDEVVNNRHLYSKVNPSDVTTCLVRNFSKDTNGGATPGYDTVSRESTNPTEKQINCVCPPSYAAPAGTATTYDGDSYKIPKVCTFQGSCPTDYSPYNNSKTSCIKNTCDEGFYAVGEKCAPEQFRACGLENKVVDKSSNTTAGAVCYGIKTSNRMTTIQIYDTPLQGASTYTAPITKAISKTGRFVRLWPAIKTAKRVSLVENFAMELDVPGATIVTSGNKSSTPPAKTCPAGSDPITRTDTKGNASYYCRPRQCADSGYIVKNQVCVYLAWMALSQVVVKDKAGNIVSQGKPTYAFPPQSPNAPIKTNPSSLVNGSTEIKSSFDANNGWLSDEYYDGDTDTFWQVDLGDNIEIGTIDIYPHNYRNSSGGNYPYDTDGMSRNGIYDQITGMRIEISNSPRALPFSTRNNKIIWNDTAAFKQLDCVEGFYKKDCGDGKGVQCLVEGIGCPGDCPPGLRKNTPIKNIRNKHLMNTTLTPPENTCQMNMYSLSDMQLLARTAIVKSDYYNVDGSTDYNSYNTALVAANKKASDDYCMLISALRTNAFTQVGGMFKIQDINNKMDQPGFDSCPETAHVEPNGGWGASWGIGGPNGGCTVM